MFMLFIVCALACEARSLISHFRLELIGNASPFPVYTSSSIGLIVTGVGKIQTASAVGYLQGLMGNRLHSAWLNVGIAGHASMPLGSGILAHQILDRSSGRSYYPTFVIDRPVKTASVWTVEQPETHYEGDGVYEMEAAAFWGAASRFTITELIHCYKIISDNSQSGAFYLTKGQVEELIQAHLISIETFIHSLQKLSHSLAVLDLSNEEVAPFLKQWHFTHTQQCQLKRLLQRWKLCTNQSSNLLWDAQLLAQPKAQQVLRHLDKRLQNLFHHGILECSN